MDNSPKLALANEAILKGRWLDAELALRDELQVGLGSPGARTQILKQLFGVLQNQNKTADATAVLEQYLEISSDDTSALKQLASLYWDLEKLTESAACCARILELEPNNELIWNSRGVCFLELGNILEAIACFQEAVRLSPGTAAFEQNLGKALKAAERWNEAASAYKRALQSEPNSDESLSALAEISSSLGDPSQQLLALRRLKSIRPLRIDEQLLFGNALAGIGELQEALLESNGIIDKERSLPGAWFLRGNVYLLMGSHKEACADFQRAIELNPKFAIVYFYLTQSKKMGAEDRPTVTAMEELAFSMPKEGLEYGVLNLALGNAYNGLKEYETALNAFDEANRTFLAQDKNKFSPENLERYIDNLISIFDKKFFQKSWAFSNSSTLPLFVVGMPRSGTTLAESILASHPDVSAGGEIAFWGKAAPAIVRDREGRVEEALAATCGKEYLDLLLRLGPNAKRVTDKLPANHLNVGILHAIFPEARFLHCRRNPVDTCLSFYMASFNKPPSYAHNRENIVFYYRQYARLMRHWREVIPEDRFMDVVYEDLVVHQEELSRKIIVYCGLEWNDACLAPEKKERPVSTASHYQVRQPVYTTSVERWRNYEPWLGVFKELLNDPPAF